MASTLEQRWNDALIELEDVQNQIAELQQKENVLTPATRRRAEVGTGSPAALEKQSHVDKGQEANPSTLDPGHHRRKTPTRQGDSAPALARRPVRGSRVELPRPAAERWRHSEALVQRVRELAQDYSDEEIAAQLNAEGLRSKKATPSRGPAFPGYGTSTRFHRWTGKSRENKRCMKSRNNSASAQVSSTTGSPTKSSRPAA